MKLNSWDRVIKEGEGGHLVRTPKNFQKVNRATARKRVIDRTFTKRGFEDGVRIGTREWRAIHRIVRRRKRDHDSAAS